MKKRMIRLMMIFCMAGILTINPAIIGQAEELSAVGEDSQTEVEVQSQEDDDVAVQDASDQTVEFEITYVFNYGAHSGKPATITNGYYDSKDEGATVTIDQAVDETARQGYEFIGWYKDGTFYDINSQYTLTAKDVADKKITFTAAWRQKVSAAIDSEEYAPMEGEEVPSKTEVIYQFPSTISETTDTGDFTFANKWMINDKGPFGAGDPFTLTFADTDGDCIYNVCANETYGIEAGNEKLKLDSCVKPADNQYAVWLKNQSNYTIKRDYGGDITADIGSNTEAYIGTVKDSLTFYEPNSRATFSKTVEDILKQNTIKYLKQDDVSSHYVECNVLTIENHDIVRTVNVTYEDQYHDTKTSFTFNNESANSYTYSKNIYPGVEGQTWDTVLNETIQANRGTYEFAGWKYVLDGVEYTLEDLSKMDIDFYADEGKSLVVQPVWEGTYSYDVNLSEDANIEVPEGGYAIVGESIELPQLDDISGKYTFAGWHSSEDQKIYQAGYSYPIKEAKTVFTAQWNSVSHKITFVDGTNEDTTTAEYGSAYKWNRLPKKEGYTFQGWKSNEWNEVYPASGELTVPEYDLTFTAQWKINSYKISYEGNGATMGVPTASAEQDYQTAYTIEKVIPSKTGYTFQGWSDGTSTYQPGASFKVPAKNVVLTAQWKINSHQVKYDGNGGTKVPGSQQVDYNSKVTVSGEASRDGYTFVGWERISTGEVLSSGHSFVMPDMDETLKAKWKVAHSKISGKGSFYLVSEQSYTMGSGVKVQGDSSNYSENITFYVPQSGYYTFE